MSARIIEDPDTGDRTALFRDRDDAGEALAALIMSEPVDALLLAIPSGGVPVAVALHRATGRPLDVAVVSKITLPWNSEVGYGAVAFDGTARLDDDFVREIGLDRAQIEAGIAATRAKVERRVRALCAGSAAPAIGGRAVILVDDGLASGFTMLVAIEAVRRAGASRVAVAVPTAQRQSAERVAREADAVYCANVRGGHPFAVADAYREWRDVPEDEARQLLTAR